MALFNFVYVSSATLPFSEEDLLALLGGSRSRNEASQVTGMLLYRDGNFMQALEGEEANVRSVHARIARDSRHTGLITLLQGPIQARIFSNWTMGFRNLDSAEVRNTPGYNEFLNDDWRSPKMLENPTRARRLLECFRQNMR